MRMQQDLMEFARQNGISAGIHGEAAPSDGLPLKADGEVDLSADLMDIFFAGDQDAGIEEDSGLQPIPEVPEEAAIEALSRRSRSSRRPDPPRNSCRKWISISVSDFMMKRWQSLMK